MTQTRQPAGIPTGGQFAPNAHLEASVGISDDRPWSWDTIAEETSQAHIEQLQAEGVSVGEAVARIDAEWAAVGVTTKAQRDAMIAGDLKPDDESSDNRDLAMHFASCRGDLAFEGRLLSNAYDLGLHHCTHPANQGRVMAAPPLWDDYELIEQIAYLDGYGACLDAIADARTRQRNVPGSAVWSRQLLRDRGPRAGLDGDQERTVRARRAGWERAVYAESVADEIAGEHSPYQAIYVANGDTPGRRLKLDHLKLSTTFPGRFTGAVHGPSQVRVNAEGETLPRQEGQRVLFAIDEIVQP